MIDLDAMDAEIRARIRSQVTEFAYDDISDNLDDELLRACNTPAVFTQIVEPSAAELSPGLKSQKIDCILRVGIVTQSVAKKSAALTGAKGSGTMKRKTKLALQFFKPANAFEKLKFRGEEDPLRMGGRVLRELRFAFSIHEQYT